MVDAEQPKAACAVKCHLKYTLGRSGHNVEEQFQSESRGPREPLAHAKREQEIQALAASSWRSHETQLQAS